MALPGILQKPLQAYQDHKFKQRMQREALKSPASLVETLTFLKPGCALSLHDGRLTGSRRNWVNKYLDGSKGGKAAAAGGLRFFADLQKRHNEHPIAKKAAEEFSALLPKQNSDSQTAKYQPQMLDLAKRMANPTAYEHELETEIPAQPLAAAEPPVIQQPAAEAPAPDPFETTRQELLDRRSQLQKTPSANEGLPHFADVVAAVEAVKQQEQQHFVVHSARFTPQRFADELIKKLAPPGSPDRAKQLENLMAKSPLLPLVDEPVAEALLEKYRDSLKDGGTPD